MAPRKQFMDVFSARFKPGTADAIDSVLVSGESPADFIRTSVAAEIDRRQRKGRRLSKAVAADTVEVSTKSVPPEAIDWCARVPADQGD